MSLSTSPPDTTAVFSDPLPRIWKLLFFKSATQEAIRTLIAEANQGNPHARRRLITLYPPPSPRNPGALLPLKEMARHGHYGAWHLLENTSSSQSNKAEGAQLALAEIAALRPRLPEYTTHLSTTAVLDFLGQGASTGDSAALAYLASLARSEITFGHEPKLSRIATQRLQGLDLTCYLGTPEPAPLHTLMESATVGNASALAIVKELACSAPYQREAWGLFLDRYRLNFFDSCAHDVPWLTTMARDLPTLVAEPSGLSFEIVQRLSDIIDTPGSNPVVAVIAPRWRAIDLAPFIDQASDHDVARWGRLGHTQALDRIDTWDAIPFKPGQLINTVLFDPVDNITLAYDIAATRQWRTSAYSLQEQAATYLHSKALGANSSALSAFEAVSRWYPDLADDAYRAMAPALWKKATAVCSFLGTGAIGPVTRHMTAQVTAWMEKGPLGTYLETTPNPIRRMTYAGAISDKAFGRVEHGIGGLRMGLGTLLYEGSIGQVIGRKLSTREVLFDTALMLGAGIVASIALKPLFAHMLIAAASPLGHFAHTALTFGLHRLTGGLLRGNLHLSWQDLGQAAASITLGGAVESFTAARLGIAGTTFAEILKNSHTLGAMLGNGLGHLSRGTVASFFGNAGNDVFTLGKTAVTYLTQPPDSPPTHSPVFPFQSPQERGHDFMASILRPFT